MQLSFHRKSSTLCSLALSLTALAAHAEDGMDDCRRIRDDKNRLACYDAQAEKMGSPREAPAADAMPKAAATPVQTAPTAAAGYLDEAWKLSDAHSRKLTELEPYHTNYIIGKVSSNPNKLPGSPTPGRTFATPLDLDNAEAKFQLSFKTEVMKQRPIDLFGFRNLRIWGAYTQQSFWQVLNGRNSRPFRESNYEPELIFTFGTGNEGLGLKLVNIGLVHQSNGQANPQSRSWNRIYAQGGWEMGNNISLLARTWWRVPEKAVNDDNPDILDYVGRGDMLVHWQSDDRKQAVSLLLRHTLRLNPDRGFAQLDWGHQIGDQANLRFHVQLSSGFGESLIDYNHRQNTFGFGLSFGQW